MTLRNVPENQPGLRFFLDTADRDALRRWLPTGLFHGVTTNPTILDRAGLPCTLADIASLVSDILTYPVDEVQAQCWGVETDRLIETGLALAALDPRMVVKVPITENGIRAVSALHAYGVRTTLTAVYAAHQALTAAAAASDYVAPYFGRIGDHGGDALAIVTDMQRILKASGSPTRLLVASLRKADDLAMLAAAGCDTFTFSPAVAEQLFSDPLTIEAAAVFEKTAAGGGPRRYAAGTRCTADIGSHTARSCLTESLIMSGSVLCLGEAVIDFIPVVSPDVPTGEGNAYRPCPGGSSYNVARALGRLGVETWFGRAVSTDLFGDQLVAGLEQSRVKLDFLQRLNAPSTLGFVSLDQAEPAYAFFDEGAADRICETMPDSRDLSCIDLLHFGSIALIREPTASAYEALFMREAGGERLISFDPNIRASLIRDEKSYRARMQRLLHHADIIKISGADLDWLYPGISHDCAAHDWLGHRAHLVVITRGKEGVSGWTPTAQAHASAIPTNVVDTVGAGDSFMAGLLAALSDTGFLAPAALRLIDEDSLHTALAYGQKIASATCARRGADSPWRESPQKRPS